MEINIATIIVAAIIWVVSICHMYTQGKNSGVIIGNKIGVGTTLRILEEHGVVNEESYIKIIDGIRNGR